MTQKKRAAGDAGVHGLCAGAAFSGTGTGRDREPGQHRMSPVGCPTTVHICGAHIKLSTFPLGGPLRPKVPFLDTPLLSIHDVMKRAWDRKSGHPDSNSA